MVIGHEITHGFDNNGRNFGPVGQYENWWTNASSQAFQERAQCFIDQYNSYTVTLSNGTVLSVNGEHTLSENLADGGGSHISSIAFAAQAPSQQVIPEYTNDQLGFMWFAHSWCSVYSDAAMIRQLQDVHSPAKWRVNGPLSNNPNFAKAFKCSASTPMGRSLTNARCEMW